MKQEVCNAPIIVCPDCGNYYEISKISKDTPCSHQKEFIDEINADPRFKE